MNTLNIITLVIAISTLLITYRMSRVSEFRIQILDMQFHYCQRRIEEGTITNDIELDNAYKMFIDKYSYFRMVFSFKPLKLEYWYTQEEINELNR